MHRGLLVSMVNAKATAAKDKQQILNNIAGKSETAAVDPELAVYGEVDRRLRSRFAFLSIRSAVLHYPEINITDRGNLPIARAIREDSRRKVFKLDLSCCWKMTNSCLQDVVSCLPEDGDDRPLNEVNLKLNMNYQLTSASAILQKLQELRGVQRIYLDFEGCLGLGSHADSDNTAADLETFGKIMGRRESLKKVELNFSGCRHLESKCECNAALNAMTEHLQSSSSIKERKGPP